MIKVKMYNTWHNYKTKQQAVKDLLEGMTFSEGSERERYTYAFLEIKNGRKVIDTDSEIY